MRILKSTTSICPECHIPIKATIYEKAGKVYIKKECEEHGSFEDVYWSDYNLYAWADKFLHDGKGIENPKITKSIPVCPLDCGLCNYHLSGTVLANLFVTNRCDMRCSYCFANVGAAGKVFEPDLETIEKMLIALRSERPVPTKAIQITGGEPTLREDLIDIIKLCKKHGFTHVQLNTNGIRLGTDPELAKKVREAGVNTVYLSFDSVKKKLKGGASKETLNAIENCRKAGLGIVLVPVLLKNYNLAEVWEIIKFAAKNKDIIRGVNFQPVSFVGAMSPAQRRKIRVTIPDLLIALEKQSKKKITRKAFYPISCVVPITHLAEALSKKPEIEFSAHPHCGVATYLYIDDSGEITPITDIVDADKFFQIVEEVAKDLEKGGLLAKIKWLFKGYFALSGLVRKDKAPKDFNLKQLLLEMLILRNYKSLGKFHYKTLFVGTMHFMDAYNYDVERVRRCVIHYVLPDERIVPFCAFNGLPELYLMKMQQDFGIPIEEWEKKTGKKLKDDLYKLK
ncbi:MAG: radical SAM protein [archaeon]